MGTTKQTRARYMNTNEAPFCSLLLPIVVVVGIFPFFICLPSPAHLIYLEQIEFEVENVKLRGFVFGIT